MKGTKMLTKTFKKMFIFAVVSLFSFNLHAADWTMASGYPKSNFHTQNIIKFHALSIQVPPKMDAKILLKRLQPTTASKF